MKRPKAIRQCLQLKPPTTMLHPSAINLNISFGNVLAEDHAVNTIYYEDQAKRLVIPPKATDTLTETILVKFSSISKLSNQLKNRQ